MATLTWYTTPNIVTITKTDGTPVYLTRERKDDDGNLIKPGSIVRMKSNLNTAPDSIGKVIGFRFSGGDPPTGIFLSIWNGAKWGGQIEAGPDDYENIDLTPSPQVGGRRRKLKTRHQTMRKHRKSSRRRRM